MDNKEELVQQLKEDDVTYIEFEMGLLMIFQNEKVNIRQYAPNGECLSSWIDKERFFNSLDLINPKLSIN